MIEFKESSKELEKELEAMLEMNEDELKDVRQRNAKLDAECEFLKVSVAFSGLYRIRYGTAYMRYDLSPINTVRFISELTICHAFYTYL